MHLLRKVEGCVCKRESEIADAKERGVKVIAETWKKASSPFGSKTNSGS